MCTLRFCVDLCGLRRWLGLYSFNYVCKLCYQRITRLFYSIYSGQKYKNEHDYINCQSD